MKPINIITKLNEGNSGEEKTKKQVADMNKSLSKAFKGACEKITHDGTIPFECTVAFSTYSGHDMTSSYDYLKAAFEPVHKEDADQCMYGFWDVYLDFAKSDPSDRYLYKHACIMSDIVGEDKRLAPGDESKIELWLKKYAKRAFRKKEETR